MPASPGKARYDQFERVALTMPILDWRSNTGKNILQRHYSICEHQQDGNGTRLRKPLYVMVLRSTCCSLHGMIPDE